MRFRLTEMTVGDHQHGEGERAPRRRRADAQRNVGALPGGGEGGVRRGSGVDAPVKEIAQRAGVGVGTLYRHFPRRADLVKAVIESRIDALAESAAELAATHAPGRRARAVAAPLHRAPRHETRARNGAALRRPGLRRAARLLLRRASSRPSERCSTRRRLPAPSRGDVEADHLLWAIAHLCLPMADEPDSRRTQRMVTVFIDGLRCRAVDRVKDGRRARSTWDRSERAARQPRQRTSEPLNRRRHRGRRAWLRAAPTTACTARTMTDGWPGEGMS